MYQSNLETRLSLVERVRDPSDAAAWAEFVTVYQPLLTAYLRKRGVNETDAADIVQEVFTRLVPAMARFQLDHRRGRFRTWLWQVAHTAMIDWTRRRAVRTRAEQQWADDHELQASPSPDDAWNELYRERILEVTLKRVRESAQPTAWACFEGRILADRPAAQIAAELGVSTNVVYVNASRLLARVREECAQFAESQAESPTESSVEK
jgi:RNA polymerase sigma-70 factor (ECF subfamily)